ncbi:hypothetical protein ACU8KH_04759 [Lachancea thermotolerans]
MNAARKGKSHETIGPDDVETHSPLKNAAGHVAQESSIEESQAPVETLNKLTRSIQGST